MRLELYGISHKRAYIDIREKFSVPDNEIPVVLQQIKNICRCSEVVLLSTCNRMEVYYSGDSVGVTSTKLADFFSKQTSMQQDTISQLFYHHVNQNAVKHLFRVTSGLDSMVVGETQVLNQVKKAYLLAQNNEFTGKLLNKAFQHAFYTAKQVHFRTSISSRPVSIPSIAANLAQRIFENLASKTMLIIGAGETGTLAVISFLHRGVKDLFVTNRTFEKSLELQSKLGGKAIPFEQMNDVLPKSDIIVSCISSDRFVLGDREVHQIMKARKDKPLLILDLAVPRDIHPAVNLVDCVYLYNIDDLQKIADENLIKREKELAKAEKIIDSSVHDFIMKHPLEVADTIFLKFENLLRQSADEVVQSEPSQEERLKVEGLINKVVDKTLDKLQQE